jgi:hypothetical protein
MTNKSVSKVLIIGAEPLSTIDGEMLQYTGYEVIILELELFHHIFREDVNGWCDGRFLDAIFHQNPKPGINVMISALVAGYACRKQNPYVRNVHAGLNALTQLCR